MTVKDLNHDEKMMRELRDVIIDPQKHSLEIRTKAMLRRAGHVLKSDLEAIAESIGGKTHNGFNNVYDLLFYLAAESENPCDLAEDNEFGVESVFHVPPNPLEAIRQRADSRVSEIVSKQKGTISVRRQTVVPVRRSASPGSLPARSTMHRRLKYEQHFQRRVIEKGQTHTVYFQDFGQNYPVRVFALHLSVYPTCSQENALRFFSSMVMKIVIDKDIAYQLHTPAIRYQDRHLKFGIDEFIVGQGQVMQIVLEPIDAEDGFDIEELIKVTCSFECIEDKPIS